MHLAQYQTTKKTISTILASCEAGLVTGEEAAGVILAAIAPAMERALGMDSYFACAKGWLTQVLLVEPKLSLSMLADRLNALTEISPGMRLALGGINGRLTFLCHIT